MTMDQDPMFALFHRYNRLVRRQMVKPLTHSCGGKYIFAMDDHDKFFLHCYRCDAEIYPGLALISDVRAVVKEHFLDGTV